MFYLIFLIIPIIIYFYVKKSQNFWKERGINYIKPTFLFGNALKSFIKNQTLHEVLKDDYNQFPNARYYGIYDYLTPNLVIRDPELIKQIIIKDFDYFINHERQFATTHDPFFSRNIFEMRDDQWRKKRQFTSQLFTLSRLRIMHKIMSKNVQNFLDYLNEQNVHEFEMKELFSKVTTDIAANTIFGINSDSLKNQNNEFHMMGNDLIDLFSFKRILRTKFIVLFPKLSEWLHMMVVSSRSVKFWKNLVDKLIKTRRNLIGPDVISFMLESRKRAEKDNPQIDMSDLDITGNTVNFILADFDATSSLMSFVAYELALNPDIQDRLYHEIMEMKREMDGEIDFRTLMNMDYLDMIVNELNRKWSATITIDRVCTKTYEIPPKLPGESPLVIEKGQKVLIPIYGLQMDPKYYPNPEKFDPERFSKENSENIVPYTNLPYGSGPRSCLAVKYIELQIKSVFSQLLVDYEIVPTVNTKGKLPVSDTFFYMNGKYGVWVGLKSRKN